MPKLFVEYVGMGDSDKPKDYPYSTAERTDLVEAIWRTHSVESTTLVAFDFSSLVVPEHLRRRLGGKWYCLTRRRDVNLRAKLINHLTSPEDQGIPRAYCLAKVEASTAIH
jgi:hypothetical protein